MMNNLILILVLCFTHFIPKDIHAQNQCDIEIIDTLSFKKGFFVIYTDTTRFRNTSNRTITFFLMKRKEFNSVNIDSIDNYPLFRHSHNLITNILVYNRALLEHLKTINSKYNSREIKIQKIKTQGLYTLYSISSPNGFVLWKLSKENHNSGLPLEGLPYPGTNNCIYNYTPIKDPFQ